MFHYLLQGCDVNKILYRQDCSYNSEDKEAYYLCFKKAPKATMIKAPTVLRTSSFVDGNLRPDVVRYSNIPANAPKTVVPNDPKTFWNITSLPYDLDATLSDYLV